MKKLKILIGFGVPAIVLLGMLLGLSAAVTAAGAVLYSAGWVGVYFYVKKIHFYRDPPRISEDADPKVIVSPADGRVMYIERVSGGVIVCDKLGEKIPLTEVTKLEAEGDGPASGTSGNFRSGDFREGWLIGIYMSPMDVHFNYAPCEGTVEGVYRHQARVNLPMVDMWEYVNFVLLRKAVNLFSRKFHFENERATLYLRRSLPGGERGDGGEKENPGDLKLLVVLIADKFVNKIKLFTEPGKALKRSEKIGFIDRGSQADLFIARADIDIAVKVGQKTCGGKTVVARLP